MSTTDEPVVPIGDGGLVRLRIDLGYDGTAFSGWARQPGRRTVQGELEAGLARVLRHDVALTVAGRTDAGVHAQGQVAHLDLPEAAAAAMPDRLVRRLAGVLPPDVRVTAVDVSPEGFDARFSPLWRAYRYRIDDSAAGPPPLRRFDTVHHKRSLAVPSMQRAALAMLGEHDFAAFCKKREGATTIRELQSFDVARDDDGTIVFELRADAFCHSMVRSLVGALIAVGEDRQTAGWPASLLAATERANGVAVAPPHGLTLMEVGYPTDDELASRAEVTRQLRVAAADAPTGDSPTVSGWIMQENLGELCRTVAAYTAASWSDAEDERMVSALPDTDVDAGRWTRHRLRGAPSVQLSVAQDDGESVYIVEITGPMSEVLAARLDTAIDLL